MPDTQKTYCPTPLLPYSLTGMANHAMFRQFRQRQRLVEMFGPPGEQAFCEFQPQGEMPGLVGQVGEFARVCLQVEQQRRQAAAEMHVLEFFGANDGEIALARSDAEMPFGLTLGNRAEVELP